MSAEQKRAAYQNILGEMGGTMTTNNVTQRFNPAGGDSINGSLTPRRSRYVSNRKFNGKKII